MEIYLHSRGLIKYILFLSSPSGIYLSTLKRRAESSPSASVTIMTGLPPATLRARRSTSASSSPGATGITWHSPPAFCAASATSALCSGFRRADRLKRPAMRARSFITSMLAIPQPFQMRFNSKACYFFVNKLCFPKNPAGYPNGWQAGSFLSIAAPIFDY